MLAMVEVPETIRKGLRPYGDLFRRAEGFAHVSRYVTGLIVSPNKTVQGIVRCSDFERWHVMNQSCRMTYLHGRCGPSPNGWQTVPP